MNELLGLAAQTLATNLPSDIEEYKIDSSQFYPNIADVLRGTSEESADRQSRRLIQFFHIK